MVRRPRRSGDLGRSRKAVHRCLCCHRRPVVCIEQPSSGSRGTSMGVPTGDDRGICLPRLWTGAGVAGPSLRRAVARAMADRHVCPARARQCLLPGQRQSFPDGVDLAAGARARVLQPWGRGASGRVLRHTHRWRAAGEDRRLDGSIHRGSHDLSAANADRWPAAVAGTAGVALDTDRN